MCSWSDYADAPHYYCPDLDIFSEEITGVSDVVAWLGKVCHAGTLLHLVVWMLEVAWTS